jgi:hypothetical protein
VGPDGGGRRRRRDPPPVLAHRAPGRAASLMTAGEDEPGQRDALLWTRFRLPCPLVEARLQPLTGRHRPPSIGVVRAISGKDGAEVGP